MNAHFRTDHIAFRADRTSLERQSLGENKKIGSRELNESLLIKNTAENPPSQTQYAAALCEKTLKGSRRLVAFEKGLWSAAFFEFGTNRFKISKPTRKRVFLSGRLQIAQTYLSPSGETLNNFV